MPHGSAALAKARAHRLGPVTWKRRGFGGRSLGEPLDSTPIPMTVLFVAAAPVSHACRARRVRTGSKTYFDAGLELADRLPQQSPKVPCLGGPTRSIIRFQALRRSPAMPLRGSPRATSPDTSSCFRQVACGSSCGCRGLLSCACRVKAAEAGGGPQHKGPLLPVLGA